ncbi:VirE N-terminal domain-containing protein [Algoriphagus alkaliphilus]|uniref:VirE N-terminal domain-containing protein n=1 Tax=Algoriphagus alkaliphilus TaxID=279824 RepID=A0A1G5X207_9BACT|nr:CRISPR-associated primase-polymerase type B [Algoriphagus alkaliphilus]SDA64458.1 VirE N-terminal domain-containing protein [Algoriphagus alkaliphilus]
MIRLGKQVTQAGDQLQDITLVKFHKALLNPDGEVATLQRRLQAIRALDPAQYRRLKTTLPYVVCADFHPKVRRKENFLHADRFILDIDHLSDFGHDLEELRTKLKLDPQVELLFASPGGDGLKVLFKLDKPISDAAYYAGFYKAFGLVFRNRYQLGEALDIKTHDVSRCCFVSFDPGAYHNPESEGIQAEIYLKQEDLFALDELKAAVKEATAAVQHPPSPENSNQELPDEVIKRIKEKMGMKVHQPRQKDYVQPEELEEIMDLIKGLLEGIQLELSSVRPISYGRQCKINSGKIWAELNIFFGRRGANVVATTKSGSNKELAKQLVEYLQSELTPYS